MGRGPKEKKARSNQRIDIGGDKSDRIALGRKAEESGSRDLNYLDVTLVNVSLTTQKVISVHDKVLVKGLSIYCRDSHLGDVPHRLTSEVSEGGYTKGYVLNVDAVIVRLLSQKNGKLRITD